MELSLTNSTEIDRIHKIETRIIRTCINKNKTKMDTGDLHPTKSIQNNIYKEIEPVVRKIVKKRITFLKAVYILPENGKVIFWTYPFLRS